MPEGVVEIAETLRSKVHKRVGDAAIDLLDRIVDRPTGIPILRSSANERYGRFGKRGGQSYVWDKVRDELEAQRIIAQTSGYVVKLRAKKYALELSWRNRPRLRVENPIGPRYPRESNCPIPTPIWLEDHIAGAQIDTIAATRFLLHEVGADTTTAQALAEHGDFNEIGRAVRAHAGLVAAHAVTDRLVPMYRWQRDGHTWTTRDPNGWRVHTPISNLPAELRPFLRFGAVAEPLAEIDATNSQAVFLAAVAHRELACTETEEFADICGRGQFYEETYRVVYGVYPTREQRSGWKERIFETWLYANLGCQVGSPIGRSIGARFPTIHKWMGDIKRANGTAHLPCAMQRAEAHLWIDTLVPRLEMHGIPAFTVHDCIIVPESASRVSLGLIEALYDEHGMRARFGVKVLARPSA